MQEKFLNLNENTSSMLEQFTTLESSFNHMNDYNKNVYDMAIELDSSLSSQSEEAQGIINIINLLNEMISNIENAISEMNKDKSHLEKTFSKISENIKGFINILDEQKEKVNELAFSLKYIEELSGKIDAHIDSLINQTKSRELE